KQLARRNVPLIQWNRHFHDHEIEIATGRVQVFDVTPEDAKAIAQKASGTDGITRLPEMTSIQPLASTSAAQRRKRFWLPERSKFGVYPWWAEGCLAG